MPQQLIPPPTFNIEEKRKFLLDKMAELDAIKRNIKNQIREKSNNFDGKKDREFFIWLRKSKSKISHLQEVREECRRMIGEINEKLKARKRVLNSHTSTHAQFFMAAAQELLDEETFDRISAKAVEINPAI